MKNVGIVKLTGVAVATLILLQMSVAALVPRGNTLTVIPTTSGPWLCGPAFVMENMGGQTWRMTSTRTTPVVPSTGSWYSPLGSAKPNPFARPVSSPASPILPSPPRPDEILCRPLFMPRSTWPGQPPGAYGGSLRG